MGLQSLSGPGMHCSAQKWQGTAHLSCWACSVQLGSARSLKLRVAHTPPESSANRSRISIQFANGLQTLVAAAFLSPLHHVV